MEIVVGCGGVKERICNKLPTPPRLFARKEPFAFWMDGSRWMSGGGVGGSSTDDEEAAIKQKSIFLYKQRQVLLWELSCVVGRWRLRMCAL